MQQSFPCSNCGSLNASDQQFCLSCGDRLQYSCPQCGAVVDVSSRFCLSCGAELNWGVQQIGGHVFAADSQDQREGIYREAKAERKKGGTGLIISIALLVVLLIAIGIIFALDAFTGGVPVSTPVAEEPLPPPSPAPVVIKEPVIVSLDVDPKEITIVESATLQWDVTGATEIVIDQGVGEVPPAGTEAVSPDTSTIYRLTATNAGGSVTRTITVKVIENVNAADIALTREDGNSDGFVFDFNSEPAVADTISTHYVRFRRGSEILDNAVSIHTTVAAAEKRYSDIKFKNKVNVTDIVTIGDRGYLLTYVGVDSEEPTTYSIRFQKSNVYVSIGGISDYEDIEFYARIVESRIR